MYVRVNTIFGAKELIGAGVAHVEDVDRGAVEATPGNRGLTTLVDRDAGVIVAMSYWDEPEHASAEVLTRARVDAADAAGGAVVAETYEVAIADEAPAPLAGAAVTMTRVHFEPERLADGVAYLRADVLPRLAASAGLLGAEVLVDRQAGRGLLVTTWADESGAQLGDALLAQAGPASADAGVTFPRAEAYVLVGGSARSV